MPKPVSRMARASRLPCACLRGARRNLHAAARGCCTASYPTVHAPLLCLVLVSDLKLLRRFPPRAGERARHYYGRGAGVCHPTQHNWQATL